MQLARSQLIRTFSLQKDEEQSSKAINFACSLYSNIKYFKEIDSMHISGYIIIGLDNSQDGNSSLHSLAIDSDKLRLPSAKCKNDTENTLLTVCEDISQHAVAMCYRLFTKTKPLYMNKP